MTNTKLIGSAILGTLLAISTPAQAQDAGGDTGLAVGVETMLSSDFGAFAGFDFPGVAAVTYDTGGLYVSGLLSFVNVDDSVTFLGIGARLYYPVHRGDRSDFAVGGGVALSNVDPAGPGDSDTIFHLEGGVRIRTWLTSNVALGTGLGLGIVIDDNDGGSDDNAFGILGNLLGSVGLSYYFW